MNTYESIMQTIAESIQKHCFANNADDALLEISEHSVYVAAEDAAADIMEMLETFAQERYEYDQDE